MQIVKLIGNMSWVISSLWDKVNLFQKETDNLSKNVSREKLKQILQFCHCYQGQIYQSFFTIWTQNMSLISYFDNSSNWNQWTYDVFIKNIYINNYNIVLAFYFFSCSKFCSVTDWLKRGQKINVFLKNMSLFRYLHPDLTLNKLDF